MRCARDQQGSKSGARRRLAIGLVCFMAIFTVAVAVDAPPAAADDFTITFEEAIAIPQDVGGQYCEGATNLGVDFLSFAAVFDPDVATNSESHAVRQQFIDDVDPWAPSIVIAFTTGQSHVGVRVGLGSTHAQPVTATLRAYDDPDLGEGNKVSAPDPTVVLGTQPTPIHTLLGFSTTDGQATIRRIEIEFAEGSEAVQEIIDDLTFSTAGPPCFGVEDTQPPVVEIIQPTDGQQIVQPQTLLHYHAKDDASGIASIRVINETGTGTELASFFSCAGVNSCGDLPQSLSIERQFSTFLQQGTEAITVEATDHAGLTGSDTVQLTLALPDESFNLWAMAMEITQGIQRQVPRSDVSRSGQAPVFPAPTQFGPLVAGKRTVVRLFPGVEDTATPVHGARASLSCFKTLAAQPFQGEPCDGPTTIPTISASNPLVTVDPATGNDLPQLRADIEASWNFVLPPEWTEATGSGPRWLIGRVQAPLNLHECGTFTSGCDDGANLIIVATAYVETAPLIIQPRIACVRRSSTEARTDCLSSAKGSIAPTSTDALDVVQRFLWGDDWDGDGSLDPTFNTMYPVADRGSGIEIRTPVFDFVDGDLNTPTGNLTTARMSDYLNTICDAWVLEWSEVFTDPSELVATATARNFSNLAFVPPPTERGGIAFLGLPCAIAKVGLGTSNVINNQYVGSTSQFTVHNDEFNIAHELGHRFGIQHASCTPETPDHEHGEAEGGGCDPAPSVFPCPHGGICLSVDQQDQPWGFGTHNFGILPPSNGVDHAHDFMSYGFNPRWTSRHTWLRIFNVLRDVAQVTGGASLSAGEAALVTSSGSNDGGSAGGSNPSQGRSSSSVYVSGSVDADGNVAVRTVMELDRGSPSITGEGPYRMELLDRRGRVVSRARFGLVETSNGDTDSQGFFVIANLPDRASRLVIRAPHTDDDDSPHADGDDPPRDRDRRSRVIYSLDRSRHDPVVRLLSPTGGAVWTEGVQVIEWRADDRDGDELDAAVQYSDDGGASWTTLGTHVTGSSFAIDSGLLAGSEGDAVIRVIVSDGFNSTAVTSSGFSVEDRPPSVRIAAPATGATFLSNDPVVFTGSSLDPEDGSLASDSLVWTSDLDGRLGSGEQLTLDGLSVGYHVITLQAEDAAGHTVVDTIEMNVVAAPNTQPIADAGDDASVGVGEALDLDGSRSLDPDGDELAFAWTLVAAPSDQAEETVVLDGADMATPMFSAEVAGEYTIRLVVSDGEVESFAAYVTITVEAG